MSAPSLVIFLHGFGSSGADLMGLANLWRAQMPDTRFASPDAPFPGVYGSGRQWFSVAGVTETDRASRVLGARAGFDSTLSAIIHEHGLADRLDRVVLVGFSQGTIMALDALASGRWPMGKIVGFSGRLVAPENARPSLATRMLLIHGEVDPVIPASESVDAAKGLRAWGVDTELVLQPGVGHQITREGADIAGRWLA